MLRHRSDSPGLGRAQPQSFSGSRAFLEGSFDALLLLDADRCVVEANAAAAALLHVPVALMLGRPVDSLFDLKRHAASGNLHRRREFTELAGTLCTLKGADAVELTVVLKKTDGPAGSQLWALRDVTQSRPVADALEQKARLLMEAERVGRMGAWEFDPTTGLLIWTAELQRLMGVEHSATLTVEQSNRFYHGASREIVREAFKATLNHGTPYDLELEVVSGHGRRLWVRETCRATFRRGQLVSVVGVLQDISEQRRMAGLLANGTDVERARIGADLHDGLGQELTGLALLLEGAAAKHRRRDPELAADLKSLSSLARKSLRSLRDVAHRMLPLELRQTGFNQVCRQLAASTRQTLGVGVRFRYQGEPAHAPVGPTAEHLYRVAQEAIANAVKHGAARQISLDLKSNATKLVLTISDDGRGIDQQRAAQFNEHPVGGGVGLQIMRYRARLLGGFLYVERRPGGGTRVRCVVPTQGTR